MDKPNNDTREVRTRILGRSSKGFFKLPENEVRSSSSLNTNARTYPEFGADQHMVSSFSQGIFRSTERPDKLSGLNSSGARGEAKSTRGRNQDLGINRKESRGTLEIPKRTLSIGKQVDTEADSLPEYNARHEIKFPGNDSRSRTLASKVAAATSKSRDNRINNPAALPTYATISFDLERGPSDNYNNYNPTQGGVSSPNTISSRSSQNDKSRQPPPARRMELEVHPRAATGRNLDSSGRHGNLNPNVSDDLSMLEAMLDSKNASHISTPHRQSQTSRPTHTRSQGQRVKDPQQQQTYNTYSAPSDAHNNADVNEGGFDSLLKELAQLSNRTGTDKNAAPAKQPQKSVQTAPNRGEKAAMFTHKLDTSLHALAGDNKETKHDTNTRHSRVSAELLKHMPNTPSQDLSSADVQDYANTSFSTLNSNPDTNRTESTTIDKNAYRRELMETDRKRREADSIKMDRKEADRRELEMIAAARLREQGSEITGNPAIIISSSGKDEDLIVDDYLNALCSLLEDDKDSTPLPDDFYSIEGFAAWENTINMTLGAMVSKILSIRFPKGRKFIDRFSPAPALASRQLPDNNVINELLSKEPLTVSLSIFEARNIIVREGKRSAVYCEMQTGNIPEHGSAEAKKYEKSKSSREIYRTTVSEGSFPKWNQSVSVQTRNCNEKVQISVFDKRKDHFHGHLTVSYMDILLTAASGKQLKGWFPLKGLNKKEKDKYVGGDIYFEVKITSIPKGILPDSSDNKNANVAHKSLDGIINDLESIDVKFNSLFMVLIRTCLELDLRIPGGKKFNQLLSPESRKLLKIMSDVLGTSILFIDYAYLKLVYERASRNELQIISVLSSYERLKDDMKRNFKLITNEENELIVGLLSDMYNCYRSQIVNYKEVYPDNKPPRVLETIILLMRMIFKNTLYSNARDKGSLQSFRDELRGMLSEAAINRYQKLKELTDPLDDSDYPSVINGMVKLAELIYSELDADKKIYYSAFIKELDISRLTTEIYLKYFILALEQTAEIIPDDDVIKTCSESIFELHSRVQQIDYDYAKKIPGLKRYSINMGFSPERWFTAFLLKWLNFSEAKLIEWANNAVNEDKFLPIGNGEDGTLHSSSIVDLFSAIYVELKFIEDLNWAHPIQNSIFIQSFSKSVYRSIETYCSRLLVNNKSSSSNEEPDGGAISSWQSFINITQKRDLSKDVPTEIDKEICVRLCNIEYADMKLRELYSAANGSAATKIIRDYRSKQEAIKANNGVSDKESGEVCGGTFRISIVMAENLKGVSKNGTSNPYVILSLPYSTKTGSKEESSQKLFSRYVGSIGQRGSDKHNGTSNIPQTKSPSKEAGDEGSDTTSNVESPGSKKATELVRTRAQSDTINPIWDETYSVSIPKFGKLTMQVMSKNFISSDTPIGSATIDLSESSPLHRLILDNETHNVYAEVEPQGRVHLRIAMEGAFEDTDFWFRRAKECLEFLRNDIVRILAREIFPHIQDVILKSIKEQEAAVVSSKSFFSLKTTVQYLDTTADGKPIDGPMRPDDTALIIDPLFDYLNKNLTTLTDNLTLKMSQEVIRKVWEDIEQCLITCMVPQLYGTIERDRKMLNRRQLSLAENLLKELCSFFHAGGEEMGLPMRALQNMNYDHLVKLFGIYTKDLVFVKKECEREISSGKTNGLTLRCARGKIQALEGGERNEERKWFEAQLAARKLVEQSRK